MFKDYRKKPVVVQAEQFFAMQYNSKWRALGIVEYSGVPNEQYYIKTLESNRHIISEGDYIVRGVKGEYYACKPDIFHMTYELVKENE